jgi:lysophospholipase L1-like esterase
MLVVDLWSVMIMVFSVRKLVSWLILPVIAILSVSAGVFAADTVRIMPLGDSITRGYYVSAYSHGYREPLYDKLTAAGYNFDFVGSQNDGNFPDPNHEGHDGWKADNIIYALPSWLNTYRPDVVLLHIGTNDITWNDQDANEVNGILDVIGNYEDANNKHVTVILALIINRKIDSTKRLQTTQFNRDVNDMALNRIANGDDIIIVDMESALDYNNGADMADEVHPNDDGYGKMATVWYNALVDYFSRFDFTIYGYAVELDGNTPVEGVLIQTDDNDINSVTDANGYYELLVNYRWSGVATPQKEGRIFEPNGYIYTDVNQDYNDMNYIVTMRTFKIAGFVFEQDYVTPISDVNVSAENGGGQYTSRYGGGSDITDANGYYEVVVDYNWSGTVTPGKTHYTFNPNSRYYEDVNQDYTADQNYTGNRLDFRITGYIKNECNVPIEGVLVDANNGGGENITDVNGFYEVWVDSAWSGTVTPSKTHYTFDPNSMSYANVLGDIADQNYVANNIYDLDCDGSIGIGDVAVISENWLTLGGPDVPSDIHKDNDNIVNFLDFADFANVWGD